MIIYDYDSNSILLEPIHNRKGPTLVETHRKLHARLTHAGLRPKFVMLDSKCSNALKDFFSEEEMAFQLTPARIHRRNTAERAIRTAKNHIIAGLCTVHPNFPLYLWNKLIIQAELTLNMLRGSRMNPKLSARDQVSSVYDYNSTPIGPPGTHVVVHEKSQQRGTWAPHGEDLLELRFELGTVVIPYVLGSWVSCYLRIIKRFHDSTSIFVLNSCHFEPVCHRIDHS
jgi:hypothetical protein